MVLVGPGPEPIQTPPSVPSTDPATLPLNPQKSHKATAASQTRRRVCEGKSWRREAEEGPCFLFSPLITDREMSAVSLPPCRPLALLLRGRRGSMRVGLSLYLQLGGRLSSGTMWGYECLMTSNDKGLSVCICGGRCRVMGTRAVPHFHSHFLETVASLSIAFK